MWSPDLPQGNEINKVKWDLVPYTRGYGVDCGCGPWKPFKHWVGVDNETEWGGVPSMAEFKGDATRLRWFADGQLDFVVSSHLLEHVDSPKRALKEWWRVLKTGGHLCLYLPHKDFYPNIGQPGSNRDHKHDFMPKDILGFMQEVAAGTGFDLIVDEVRSGADEYSFLQVYRKRRDRKQEYPCREPRAQKTAVVVRYGAIGDMVMASTVFRGLKQQGYHVTVNTYPKGYEVSKNDPHVDAWIVQDRDQVPNGPELVDWWEHLQKKYDKFVNLSESVEATLLGLPRRAPVFWPKEAREWLMDRNYLEWHHKLAGIEGEPLALFYPTEDEKKWARCEHDKACGAFTILWSLSGSAIHKTWPYVDEVVERLLHTTGATIILTGGPETKVLEQGWENNPRVWCRSGEWTVRQTLTIAQQADLVVGTETGVLNAVGQTPVRKVVMLSHSSPEMLTKHWINATVLQPVNTPCHPCRMMHYDRSRCPRGTAGLVALCAERIPAQMVYDSIIKHHDEVMLAKVAT